MHASRFVLVSFAISVSACREGTELSNVGASGARDGACGRGAAQTAACTEVLVGLLVGGISPEARGRVERRVLARAEAERIVANASASGEPSKAELDAAADALWPRWNDGPIVDVVHALFAPERGGERAALAFASSLPEAVDEDRFTAIAKAANASAVERIEGIGNRGRTLSGLELVREFSVAVVRMTMDDPRSDIIHTPYGAHVVLLLKTHHVEPIEPRAREAALRTEALDRRVRSAVLAERGKHPTSIAPSALRTMEVPSSSP